MKVFWSAVALLGLLTACSPQPSQQTTRMELSLKDYQLRTAAYHTDAHQGYLGDPVQFQPVPDQGIAGGKTAVVGSDVCRFYPGARVATQTDLAGLGEGIAVPFGTILPLEGQKTESDDTEHNGMFSFQENWNWFYSTTFQGQKGLVFGADLFGLNDSNEDNRISALLYTTEGKSREFYPILGYQYLGPEVSERLTADRIALQAVDTGEYSLHYSSPDDFIALYRRHEPDDYSRGKWRRNVPLFVTTDLAAHALHLVFDRELQHVEQTLLVPRLQALLTETLAALESRQATSPAHQQALAKAKLYLQTGQALLALAPEPTVETDASGRETPSWATVDRTQVLAGFPEAVRAEIDLMDAHQGFGPSPVFDFRPAADFQEDYSQYKPRGHYTKNDVLKAYFRAMMWFGRIPFLMASEGLTDDNAALTRAMTPVTLVLVQTFLDHQDLQEKWAGLFDPISDLIGPSDDLSLRDLGPFWTGLGITDFDSWVSDPTNIDRFVTQAHQGLRAPQISGSSVWDQPSEGADRKPPLNWRLFGQRFTWDSKIHFEVSPPRLMSRDMVRGLDVMKAFGSKTAEVLLQKSDYPKMAGLKEKLDSLEKTLTAQPPEFWTQNYYNLSLYLVKTQAQFEPGAGFYFTETPAWGQKAMLASHGTWAELRHDTLLYVKQTYAERAGDGDFLPTFRTKPIPRPIHYLEPNTPFWQGASLAAQKLLVTLGDHGLLDSEAREKLNSLAQLFDRCVTISTREAANEAVDNEDLDFLAHLPAALVHLVLIGLEPGDNLDQDQLRMAVIADVYTNAELGKVLEVGVGKPQRLYVALNDSQGGKRIAVGYTFSYYEFDQPMGERLTDEEWKAAVYAQQPEVDTKAPFWAQGLALPPSTVR